MANINQPINTLQNTGKDLKESVPSIDAYTDLVRLLDKYHLNFDFEKIAVKYIESEMPPTTSPEDLIKEYENSPGYKIHLILEHILEDGYPEEKLETLLTDEVKLKPDIAKSLAKNIQEHILSKKEKYFGEEVEEEKPKLKIPRPIRVGLGKESPIQKEVTGGELELETKSPEPSTQPEPATPDSSIPPLDLRKMHYERPEPPPDEGFPGEIIHHGGKEEPSPSEAAEKPAEDMEKPKEPPEEPGYKKSPIESARPKIEPVKRYTPPEKDIYLEQVGEGGKDEKPEKDRGTIDLSKS